MPDPHLMHMVFGTDFAAQGEGADEEVKPIPRQYALQPGDYAAAMTSDSVVDKDLAIMQLKNPEAYKGTYPDYEDRLMKSYVLGVWKGAQDPQLSPGWFARSRLMPLTEVEYEELNKMVDDRTIMKSAPEWLLEKFRDLQDEMASVQPDVVMVRATCGKCGGRDIDIHWSMEVEGRSGAWVRNDGDHDLFVADENSGKVSWGAHLHCGDCDSHADLKSEEFERPAGLKHLG